MNGLLAADCDKLRTQQTILFACIIIILCSYVLSQVFDGLTVFAFFFVFVYIFPVVFVFSGEVAFCLLYCETR